MKNRVLSFLAFMAIFLFAVTSSATSYTLWVHGRNTGTATQQGNYADFSYWGPASTSAGVNKKAVNWDGKSYLATGAAVVRTALDRFCTGANWCYVTGHSTGGPLMGYNLALYGTSSRPVTNPDTGAGTGASQTGWNIKWVAGNASAEGGSELADLGYWAVSDNLSSDLRTGVLRPMYNHGATQGKTTYLFAGSSGTLYSSVLPGQDDEALSYHSTLGVTTTASICNWSDWFCDNYVKMDTAGTSMLWYNSGNSVWAYHKPWYIDQAESYNHYTNGAWGGTTSVVRPWVASNAL